MSRSPFRLLPVLSRYLIRDFLGMVIPIILAFSVVYLIVDFFDRLDVLLKNHATVASVVRYFGFKIPLIMTHVTPPAVLAGLLLSVGMLSRHHEIIALRASGISLVQTAVPLFAVAAVIALGILAWNETVVPYCTQQYQFVNNVEIRRRPQRGILNEREIWYHGQDGFYNIEQIDPRHAMLYGLVVYRTDPGFGLHTVIEVPQAHWTGHGWTTTGATERVVTDTGDIVTRKLPSDEPIIHERLTDFLEVHREPDELSYLALRRRIDTLTRMGIDASNYLVDLHLKLAIPFATFAFAWVGIPLAGHARRNPSLAAIVGLGLLIGFAYWMVLAFATALGQGGVLPPVVAAWAANLIWVLLGVALFLSLE